jgi:two-component system chemotaxis sensor kinase CheA
VEFDEEIREFLIESTENLALLDSDIVQLEKHPEDLALISSAFRTIHTIKGTCGFFGYTILGSVTHITENILSQLRDRQRILTPDLISLILEAVDAVKVLLANIEETGTEGEDSTGPLRARLEQAHLSCKAAAAYQAAAEDPVPHPDPDTSVEFHKIHTVAAQTPREEAPGVILAMTVAEPGTQASQESTSSKADAADLSREAKDGQLADSTIRVDVGLLNRLMNLVGELVLARNQLLQDTSAQNASLQKTSQRLNLITSELQEGVMKTRMQPIGVVWNKLPRVVRDLAAQCGKQIQIEMEGAGTELDKTIIEAIKDPLTHIVRNSCDHGIEFPADRITQGKRQEGLISLRAYHEGGVVNIEISDDGAGIHPEKLKAKAIQKGLIRLEQAAQMSTRDALHLILMPGFSTSPQITSISGRGVGMDVVKTNIEKIGGSVEVTNREQGGTTVRIKIPLTLAIIPGLIVTLDNTRGDGISANKPRWNHEERFIIPQANLLELVRVEGSQVASRIENVHGTPVFHHRGNLLPLVYLGRVLGRDESAFQCDVVNIIVLQAENRQLGLVVDRICDTQEIVVKPLGRQLKGLSCYVGATIMGDGRPALILDVAGLSRLAGLGSQTRLPLPTAEQDSRAGSQPQMMLLFRAGTFKRLAVPLALVDRLEEIQVASIERAAGQLVLYYRGDILPLVTLNAVLQDSQRDCVLSGETTQIIVFTDGVRRVGLIVDHIIDIVNETITVRRNGHISGLLGSAVVAGEITDLLDLHAVVRSCGENWLDPSLNAPRARHKVLLLDPSMVAREMIHDFLDISGYDVIQAGSTSEALPKIRQTPVDVVVTAVEMPPGAGIEFLEAMRKDRSLARIPILGLLDQADQAACSWTAMSTFDGQVVRSEREELLRSLRGLVNRTSDLEATA